VENEEMIQDSAFKKNANPSGGHGSGLKTGYSGLQNLT